MKFVSLVIAVACVMTMASCQQKKANENVKLATISDTASYVIGTSVGGRVLGMLNKDIKEVVDIEIFMKGVRDVFNKKEQKFEDPKTQQAINEFFTEAMNKKLAKKFAKEYQADLDFMKQNKTKEGVVELPSGLQYKIIKKGNGPIATDKDKVRCHYHGLLADEKTVFDSSVDRKEPFEFNAKGGLIKGWLEAAKLMPEGSKWRLYIPARLAYGGQQRGAKIKPFSTLIFDLEILKVLTPEVQKQEKEAKEAAKAKEVKKK